MYRSFKTRTLSFVFFFLFSFVAASQETEARERTKLFMKSPDGYMYIDNTKNAFYCIDFKGDSLKDSGVEGGFLIDGRYLQVVANEFDSEEYVHGQDSAKETALLKAKMQSELDYISKEVYKKPIVSGFEIFKNKDGKNYFLWHYQSPPPSKEDSVVTAVTSQYFLTFVANYHVVGVNTPVFENENTDDAVRTFKLLADRIDVFGAKINVDAMYYKLDALKDGQQIVYTDSSANYSFTVKEWLNITEAPGKDMFIATLPDIDNIQNAILVRKAKKSSYASFNAFNEKILPPKLTMGDNFLGGTFMLKKELPRPKNVNGISYKVQVMMGGSLYDCHYTTIETGTAYLVVMFTATPATFALNEPRFLEFVEQMELW